MGGAGRRPCPVITLLLPVRVSAKEFRAVAAPTIWTPPREPSAIKWSPSEVVYRRGRDRSTGGRRGLGANSAIEVVAAPVMSSSMTEHTVSMTITRGYHMSSPATNDFRR